MKTSPFNELIVEPLSLSVLQSRKPLAPGVIQMNPNAVWHAVRPDNQNVPVQAVAVAMVTIHLHALCSVQLALNVAEIPRYHLNHAAADQFIVVNATVKLE